MASETKNYSNPYRATKLWNEIVAAFKQSVPLKRHRYYLRTYEKTFIASEAVDWLHNYLCSHDYFGPSIARLQAIQLLQKFEKTNVIQGALTRNRSSKVFQDDGRLYRLIVAATPQKTPHYKSLEHLLRTPLAPIQETKRPRPLSELTVKVSNNLDKENPKRNNVELAYQCRFSSDSELMKVKEKPAHWSLELMLSPNEVADVWKSVIWNKLSLALGCPRLECLLSPEEVIGRSVQHNATNISKNGLVTLMDKSDDLPHWILSAMKCLARWPSAQGSGSCLPKYPGFESDVFSVIRDFFCNQEFPLIPACFVKLFVAAYITFSGSPLYYSILGIEQNLPLDCSANHNNKQSEYETITKPNTKAASYASHNDSVCFETAFIEAQPVTRIISNPASPDEEPECKHCTCCKSPSFEILANQKESIQKRRCASLERISARQKQKTKPTFASQFDLSQLELPGLVKANTDALSAEFNSKCTIYTASTSSLPKENLQLPYTAGNNVPGYSKETLLTHKYKVAKFNSRQKVGAAVNQVADSIKLVQNYIQPDPIYAEIQKNNTRKGTERNSEYAAVENKFCMENEQSPKENVSTDSEDTCNHSTSTVCSKKLQLPSFYSEISVHDQLRLFRVLQLALLLLSGPDRRKLNLLLRLIHKIVQNDKLLLFPQGCTQFMLVKIFAPCIFRFQCPSNLELEVLLSCKLTDFMIDHQQELFQPFEELTREVNAVLKQLRSARARHMENVFRPMTYCRQVTRETYEEQKERLSKESLRALLENIVKNQKQSRKEKEKRLKMFCSLYPDIYQERFPTQSPLETQLKAQEKKGIINRILRI